MAHELLKPILIRLHLFHEKCSTKYDFSQIQDVFFRVFVWPGGGGFGLLL